MFTNDIWDPGRMKKLKDKEKEEKSSKNFELHFNIFFFNFLPS